MPKVSKRQREHAEKLAGLRKEQGAGQTAAEAPAVPSPPPAAAPHVGDPAEHRAKSGALPKQLNAMQGGLIGELQVTKAKLEEAQQTLEARETELSSLRHLDGAEVVLRVDPHLVRPTGWSNRLERSFSIEDPAFKAFLEDVKLKGGNKVAAVVRRLAEPDGQFEYECVTGHRRLQASLLAGTMFYTHVAPSDWSDEEAMALQITENSFRLKMSAIEQGLKIESMLKPWRDETGRVGDGQLAALAEQLKFADKAYLNKLSKIGRLPMHVICAVSDARLVPFKAAYDLAVAWENNRSDVESRIESVPKKASPKEQAVYLASGSAAARSPAASITVKPPKDAAQRTKFLEELDALLARYGLKDVS